MNIFICGSKINKIYVQGLFDDITKSSYKNEGDYEEYTYYYDWKFLFFEEDIEYQKNNNTIVFEKDCQKNMI